ncbi:hypothetical protein TNCV_4631131 [Trichonephila clavipes]|nr:hypothetical protein TNCV_4631131 [Trichonephila clavipes]
MGPRAESSKFAITLDKSNHSCLEAVTGLFRYRHSTLPSVSRWMGERTRYLLLSELILTSHCTATRGLLATDHVILNHGQVTWTTPELAPPSPNYHTTPTGGRFSSRQI